MRGELMESRATCGWRWFLSLLLLGACPPRDRAAARRIPERRPFPEEVPPLKDLVDEGACVMSKEGRKVSYLVEDSVFREPTRTRVAARDSGRS